MATDSAFWDDLAEDLADPEFLRAYVIESVRIATVDRIVNALDEVRLSEHLTKADVARAINMQPAVVRRLFTGSNGNPTLATVSEVAAALGLRVTVEPISAAEKKAVTEPLRAGSHGDRPALARKLSEIRGQHARRAATA